MIGRNEVFYKLMKNLLSLTISDGTDSRLDRWLRKQYPGLQQGALEKLLRQGKIRLDGQKVQAGTRLQNGQQLTVPSSISEIKPSELPKTISSAVSLEDLEHLEGWILWEDDDLLVLNKPHGLAVQGGSKTTRHLDGLLNALGQKNKCKYRLVHRLDRDTSGVFLVAKTAEMAAHLTEGFRKGSFKKTYWAVVVGLAQPAQGTINASLSKGTLKDREKVQVDEKHGKSAVTNYHTLKKLIRRSLPYLTCLELCPETGRTHQLRVHCAHMGFPIIGDGKYGGKQSTDITKKLHLHARSIIIKDRDGNVLTFMASPPSHFEETLTKYKIEWSKF